MGKMPVIPYGAFLVEDKVTDRPMEQTMAVHRLECGACGSPLPFLDTARDTPCAQCGAIQYYAVFPAAFRAQATGGPGENTLSDEEAACFVHPGKRAVHPCGLCGRFMCSLCEISSQDQHLCPECYSRRMAPGGPPESMASFFRFDRLALIAIFAPAMIALPFLIAAILLRDEALAGVALGFGGMACILMAPVGCFVAIRYRNEPLPSVAKRRFAKMVLALAITECVVAALMFIAFCVVLAIGLFRTFGGFN